MVADMNKGMDLSIPLSFTGSNPSCYWASPPKAEVIRSGDFVGSTAEGGTVNYHQLTITPHGNGTHTETVGHIATHGASINDLMRHSAHFHALLITCPTTAIGDDQVVTLADLQRSISPSPAPEALIIRTLPNDLTKRTRQYSGTNPPYLQPEIGQLLRTMGISHLLVDLPSLDREVDGGKLAVHNGFFGESDDEAALTVTELIYVPYQVQDGEYLLNLQTPPFEHDAAPSRPVIYLCRKEVICRPITIDRTKTYICATIAWKANPQMTSEEKKSFLLLKTVIFQYHGLSEEEKEILQETASDLDALDELQWAMDFIEEDLMDFFERSREYLRNILLSLDEEKRLEFLSKVWDANHKKGFISEIEATAILKLARDWKIERRFIQMIKK